MAHRAHDNRSTTNVRDLVLLYQGALCFWSHIKDHVESTHVCIVMRLCTYVHTIVLTTIPLSVCASASSAGLSVSLFLCLSPSLSVSLCLSPSLSVSLSLSLRLSLPLSVSLCLSLSLSVSLSVSLRLSLSASPELSLSVYMYACRNVCMYVRLYPCMSLCIVSFVCIFTCPHFCKTRSHIYPCIYLSTYPWLSVCLPAWLAVWQSVYLSIIIF